ncbi:transcriptional repressor DicA [Aedoeadaptatus ivorii]|uniref:Transcriptional repressor DicA n=1 Tax=Aedoeadaptatus ivorii TaxID=54006 RepID=A0A3S5BVS1_9FIRM|nr:helix-turn-helix transcriptional regulator [Peptoniphilus ivorii]MDQ0508644.1 transcriptional regulator with XRE-family HTH domain [Peptoniphilus ivorii]VEJ34509.1 transcriptional repressor DicA [Peptoniphilus ivorii]
MDRENMGTLIAAKRKQLQMTQWDLAEKMGVTDKAVSKWERNLSVPDTQSIPKLAEVLGMSVEELMQGKEVKTVQKDRDIDEIITLIFKAVCMAMGIAVTVLGILGKVKPENAVTMLGIGLFAGGIALLRNK